MNNPELSDLEIQCIDGSIPAHRLVFLVRWPKALHNVNEDNGRKLILLMNCSKTAALAMLEFIYAGCLNRIMMLEKTDFSSLNYVVDEFGFTELKTHLNRIGKTREKACRNESKSETYKHELFGEMNEVQNVLNGENLSPHKNIFSQAQKRKCSESKCVTLPEPETYPSIELESTDSSCGRGSPDMFGESNINKSVLNQSQIDLDILASLVGKATSVIEKKFDELDETDCSKTKNGLVIVSPSCSLVNDSTLSSSKRKVMESSDSEILSLSKRPCSEWSKKASLDNLDEEDVLDLTQTSNSNECVKQDSCKGLDKQLVRSNEVVCLSESNHSEILDDSMDGLTQKDPSVSNSPQNISSTSNKTPQSQNTSDFQDYFEPAWDGYVDYLHFNYTPITTPVKPFADLSTEKKSSPNVSTQKISCLKTNVQESSLFTPKISSNVNYISSNSHSPKQSSYQDECCWKANIFDYNSLKSQKRRDSESSQEVAACTITKSRKKLSSQFESPIYFSPEHTPNTKFSQTSYVREKSIGISPCMSVDNLHKSPLKRDSLAAMQRLLEDSFDINDSVFVNADAILSEEAKNFKEQISAHSCTTNPPKKINNAIPKINQNLTTPTPEIIVSDNVTPLPDYSAMKTPFLKVRFTDFILEK